MRRTTDRVNQSVVLCAALAAGTSALGDYQGLQVQLHTNVTAGGQARSVYRVYAVCDDAGDYITVACPSPTLGNMVLQTMSSAGTHPGGTFWNMPGGSFVGISAPTSQSIANVPDWEWDTFVTIGVAVNVNGADQTGLPPGYTGISSVSNYSTNYGGCFTVLQPAQSMAGNGVAMPAGLWGVLVLQLTVNAGDHVRGTMAIGGINNNPLAGGTTFQTLSDQVFNSFPSPGGLAALAIAGFMTPRRRRARLC